MTIPLGRSSARPRSVLEGKPAPVPPASRALSLPIPLFAGLLAGILLSSGLFWPLLLALAVLLWDRRWSVLGTVLLAGALGLWRGSVEATPQPNPLAVYIGQPVRLEGDWDGQFLQLQDPPTRVALSPRPKVAAGRLELSGRIGEPPGAQNFGGFDYARWLALRGVLSVLYGAKVIKSQPAGGFRQWFERGVHAGLNERQGGLMQALELGDRDEVKDLELREGSGQSVQVAFTRAGLAHLMALSGQHVAILVALATMLLSGLGMWRYPVLLVLLGLYLALVGVQPSIVRAVLQGGAVLLALWVGRGRLEPLGTLCLAGTLSLAVYPLWVWDLGFQLSYLAVLGLILAPHLSSRLPEWKGLAGRTVYGVSLERVVKDGLLMTVAASLATLPLIAHTFGQIPWVALPANIVCGPLMVLLVPLGLLAGFLGPAGGLVNWAVGPLCDLLLALVGFFAQPDPLVWGQISPAGFALYALWALTVVLWLLRRIRARALLTLSLLALGLSTVGARVGPAREIVFLDVGQGDSTLVRVDDFAALFDGGGTPRGDYDVGAKTVVPALRSRGVFDLDLIVATHADSDHIEGLESVIRQMPVGRLWIGQRKTDDPVLTALLEAARERGVPVQEVRRGDTLSVAGLKLEVLWPLEPFNPKEDNKNSVATRISSGNFVTAVLGDTPSEVEDRLGLGPLSVLKLAHHGSRFSTSAALLAETRPRHAVISVGGRNTYGHPNAQVLERLRAQGVQVLRTDQVGAVRFALP